MYINWSRSRLNILATLPVAAAVTVWPTGAGVFEDRVTQAGATVAQADSVTRVTQAGVTVAQAGGVDFITQAGVSVVQADGFVRVTQVGVVLITRALPPPVCPGEVEGERTDGLPYTPAIPAPCAGDGTRSGSRSGA